MTDLANMLKTVAPSEQSKMLRIVRSGICAERARQKAACRMSEWAMFHIRRLSGAYMEAAFMLLPDGAATSIVTVGSWTHAVVWPRETQHYNLGVAQSPSLALLAAICKATGRSGGAND